MKKIQLLLVSIAFGACSFGQTTEGIYVKAGDDQWDRFLAAIYLYPDFKEGMVELKNGQRYLRPMNYNKVATTLEFISE